MQEEFTIQLFDMEPRRIKVPENIFENLSYRTNEIVVPALYQRTFYQMYYAIAEYLQPSSILEIGSRFGYSLIAMSYGRDVEILSIDMESYDNPFNESTQKIARANLKSCTGLNGRFVVANSHHIYIKEKFDLIHIDGDHSEEGAMQDMETFIKNLNPRGVMLVDDLDDPNVYAAWQRFKVNYRNTFIPTKHGMGVIMNN